MLLLCPGELGFLSHYIGNPLSIACGTSQINDFIMYKFNKKTPKILAACYALAFWFVGGGNYHCYNGNQK